MKKTKETEIRAAKPSGLLNGPHRSSWAESHKNFFIYN